MSHRGGPPGPRTDGWFFASRLLKTCEAEASTAPCFKPRLAPVGEHDMQSAGPSAGGWCSLLTSLVSLGNAQDGDPPHGVRACRRAIDAYEDHTVFELALSSPLVMQTLLQSCCICGGGVTDSPSLTHPEACVPFVRGEQSCVDDAQDAVRWGCCACGFGRQVSRAHTQTL